MDVFSALASVVLGTALASSCGLRAFLPLLITGLVARLTGFIEVGEAFEWLTTTPALAAFGVAALLEFSADKLPLIDTVLNVIQTPVRTLAGMLIYASVAVEFPAWVVAILALIIGGGVALSVHWAKSTIRFGVGATTSRVLGPVLSVLEDVACLVLTLLSLLLFGVAIVVAVLGSVVLYLTASTVWRRLRPIPVERTRRP